MTPLSVFNLVNYVLVFFFGAFLSVSIAGGCQRRRDWAMLAAASPAMLMLQGASLYILGLDATKELYPFMAHIPLFLTLVFVLDRPVGISLVSVCTAYLCCQLPRCGGMAVAAVTGSELVGEVVYTAIIFPILLLLQWYFVPSAREAMQESTKALFLFGSLPVTFYMYSYATSIYSDFLYSGSDVASEMLPTFVGLFYMIYTTAYRQQLQRRTQAELISSMMGGQLRQAENDMLSLRHAEAQSAAYQHDMRHHLAAIDGFLSMGKLKEARDYIRGVQNDVEAITPKRFCENELVNLLCSSFSARAGRMDVRLSLEASVPGKLSVSDTELCAVLSNGLENALKAAAKLSEAERRVDLYCGVHHDKILIEIKNPCPEKVPFRDGLPYSGEPGHGYGCRSIDSIARRCHGLCEFKVENGVFTMRVALPMQ